MWNAKRLYETAKRLYETATVGGGVPDTVARPWEAGQGQASAPAGGRRTGLDIIVGHTALFDADGPRSPEGPKKRGEKTGQTMINRLLKTDDCRGWPTITGRRPAANAGR